MTISFSFNPTLFTIIVLVTAVLAIIDGITRVRGRGGVMPVVTIILGALLGLSVFVTLPFATLTLEILLLIALVLMLVFRGGVRRGGIVVTIIAIILDIFLILTSLGWLHIPGIS